MSEKPFICQGCMTELESGNTPHNYQDCLEAKVAQLEADNAALKREIDAFVKREQRALNAIEENAALKRENETMKAWMFGHGCLEGYKNTLLTAEVGDE